MTDEVTYQFTPPEGVTPDETFVTEFTSFAKEQGLTPEAAQSIFARELTSQQAHAQALAEAAPKVPEQYELQPPKDVEVAEDLTKEIATFAKENGLTQKQAQAILEREIKLQGEGAQADKSAVEALQTKWTEELKADPELGGDKLDQTRAIAKRGLEKFFPDLAKDAAKLPFLDDPRVVRGLHALGSLISEDGDFVPGNRASNTSKTPFASFYPTMQQSA